MCYPLTFRKNQTTLHEDFVLLMLEVALMVSLQILKVRPSLDDLLKAFSKPDSGI